MYEYKATITKVVDGDTYDATIDLGFKTFTKQRLRLKGVDTPETWRPKTEEEREHGEKATEFVRSLILNKEVNLTSVKSAVYGRWEAYVTIPSGEDLGKLIIENGFAVLKTYKDIINE